MKKLFFFDGVDGAGKTSLIYKLLELSAPRNCQWYATTEPLTFPPPHVKSGIAQALHYNLSRRLHLELLADLPDDTIIVCDRGPLSTLAYQGEYYGVGATDLASLHHMITWDFVNDFDFHNIILHVPLSTALRRIKQRDGRLSEEEVTKVSAAWSIYSARTNRRSIFGTEHVVEADRFIDDLVTVVYGIIERN